MRDLEAVGPVKAAERTLDLFEAFAGAAEPMTLSELAKRIDTPLSSCHALVRTLQARGYMYMFERRRLIYPTKRLVDIANAITVHDPILNHIQPVLLQLRDITGETVILGKRHHDEVIYLEVIEGVHTIRYSANPGEHKPLHSSAAGKTFLGFLTEQELDKLLSRLNLRQMTQSTITDPDSLRREIADGRERGYFVTRGENVSDVMAIAVPIRMTGENLALILAGPAARMEQHLDEHIVRLLDTQHLVGKIDREARSAT